MNLLEKLLVFVLNSSVILAVFTRDVLHIPSEMSHPLEPNESCITGVLCVRSFLKSDLMD